MTAERTKMLKERLTRIIELKTNLRRTDYQAIKYAEGEISESDYKPILEQRRAWRAEINAIEAEVSTLRTDTDLK